jgi:hypothetical protein
LRQVIEVAILDKPNTEGRILKALSHSNEEKAPKEKLPKNNYLLT